MIFIQFAIIVIARNTMRPILYTKYIHEIWSFVFFLEFTGPLVDSFRVRGAGGGGISTFKLDFLALEGFWSSISSEII